ncbi:MFS transporter [Nitrincola sp. MINF-07-Sa-05]|uniref:MFS transporter n=1 Tax=Nitrincola salilacus TaxID=3400273 RepID=UPI003917D28A
MTKKYSVITEVRLLTLAIMIIGSNSFLLSPVLTNVAHSLDTEPVTVARAISAFGGATAVSAFLFAFSPIAGRLDTRSVLSLGGVVMALALVGCALSPNWWVLALCQGLIGLMVGVMLPTIYTAATASAPAGQSAARLGKVIRGWGIALVLGVPFSAFVSDLAGWRAAYWILAGCAALTVPGFLRLPRRVAAGNGPSGMIPLTVLRLPGVMPILAICGVYMIGFYGLYPYLGDHLHHAFGASASEAGLVVLAYGAGFGLASFVMAAVERSGLQRAFPLTLAGLAVIYCGVGPLTDTMATALPVAFVWGIINHIGVNLIILSLSRHGEDTRATLMGLHTTITYASIFAGPLMMGALYEANGFTAAALLSALLLATGAVLAFRFKAYWQPDQQPVKGTYADRIDER